MTTIVVTDLDGTLMDHARYDYTPALPALNALRDAGIPLILASSKTAAEMEMLHAQLGLGHAPYIVENGAGIVGAGISADPPCYTDIRKALNTLPGRLRTQFEGFGDMSVEAVANATGLAPEAAARAKDRAFSEPGRWRGDDAALQDFLARMRAAGFGAQRGGRFLTVSKGRTKADAMAQVAQTLQASTVIALGDAPNDIEMLEAADIGIIVRNPVGVSIPELPGEAIGKIRRTRVAGPAGWNKAILEILDQRPS